jgi:signal peptidase I
MGLVLGGVVALALIGWVASDAARRHRNWFAWATLTSLTGLLGAGLWLLARKGHPVVERLSPGRKALFYIAAVPLVLVNAVIAVFIVTFLFQVARIEGQAMSPTIDDQDRLIVNKWVYRADEPHKGDIVMLLYPLNPNRMFVKRVIAGEGDTLRIVDGNVYVNDVRLADDYVKTEFRSHDDWGPQVIPEGYYFVLGDHRNNSSDSRHWGMVPKKYILGRIQWRWWPMPVRTF